MVSLGTFDWRGNAFDGEAVSMLVTGDALGSSEQEQEQLHKPPLLCTGDGEAVGTAVNRGTNEIMRTITFKTKIALCFLESKLSHLEGIWPRPKSQVAILYGLWIDHAQSSQCLLSMEQSNSLAEQDSHSQA
jgi:hypothetical protein